MKLVRLLWIGLVNLLLILLPWVLLVGFIFQFGQPMLQFYRSYFLGNPVAEVNSFTRKLVEEPSRPINFQHINQQYRALTGSGTISDTQRRTLMDSVIQLHHAMIARMATGNPGATYRTYSDSYSRFLTRPSLAKIFPRPELVRERLLADFRRSGRLNRFPNHPARGLKQFMNAADTAVYYVRTYGNIYADQLSCQNVFDAACSRVYKPTVDLVAGHLVQYFRNWPEFGQRTTPRAGRLEATYRQMVPEYVEVRSGLQGYLEVSPWGERPELRESVQQFQENFRRNFQDWYLAVLESLNVQPEQFSPTSWTGHYRQLDSLQSLEQYLGEHPQYRDVLMSKRVRARREEFLDQLLRTYQWVEAHRRFDPNYNASPRGREELRQTLLSFTEGRERLKNQRQLLEEVSSRYKSLRSLLKNQSYGELARSLRELTPRLRPDQPLVWTIMVRQFLTRSRSRITSPSWQPAPSQDLEAYQQLVRTYRQLALEVNLDSFKSDWVEQTLLALRSRRYNQLKHDLLTLVNDFRASEVSRARELLDRLLELRDVPRSINQRTRQILIQVVLLERIQLGTEKIYRAYRSRIEKNTASNRLWNQLMRLLEPLENASETEVFRRTSFKSYVDDVNRWLKNLGGETTLQRWVRGALLERLQSFFERLHGHLVESIRSSVHAQSTRRRLQRNLNRLREGVRGAQRWKEFEFNQSLKSWQRLLALRDRLSSIRSVADSLEQGSLFGSNPTYDRYRDLLTKPLPSNLPADYQPTPELGLLSSVQKVVLDRATQLQKQSQESWFSGWGGRVNPSRVLQLWEEFLIRLKDVLQTKPARERIDQLLRGSRERRAGW